VREQGDGVWLCEIVSQAAATAIVRLTYRDQAVECTREHPSVVIGREYGCGVLVADRTASRKHCTIELRGGQFVVQDHSTNGTYVTVDSEKSCCSRETTWRCAGSAGSASATCATPARTWCSFLRLGPHERDGPVRGH